VAGVRAVRYDLHVDGMRRVTARYVSADGPSAGPYAALVFGTDHELSNVARAVERITFEEKFGNDAATMRAEYGPYEAGSWFIAVVDRRYSMPAGVIRIIEDAGAGLKSLNDATTHVGATVERIRAHHGMDDGGRTVDVATLAVLPQYRGARSGLMVSTMLYRTLYVQFGCEGVKHAVAMIDRAAFRNLTLIGVPMTPMVGSGPFEYLGAAENWALYGDFHQWGPSITLRVAELRRQARPGLTDLRRPSIRRLLFRRMAARVANSIITGEGLERHVVLR
jgi:hypothetical protein